MCPRSDADFDDDAADVPTELEPEREGGPALRDEIAYLIVRDAKGVRTLVVAEGEAVTFGRSPESSVNIDDTKSSRQHARIARQGGTLVLTDLESRNGTRVNGVVVRGADQRLGGGDVVGIGDTEIVVAVTSPAVERHAPPASSTIPPPPPRGASPPPAEFVVADEAMVKVFQVVQKLARTATTVLVLGETGTGKEVVSEQIHRASARAAGPFVRLNCASLPESLLESELFGHEKAAFTGASRRKIGYLEAAHHGTLLLDEIGELPLTMQAKLLRVLETRRVARLGATQEIELDVRVICATHRDLTAEVARGAFRQDLFYRISTFVLKVPPLRERRAEIALLAHRFAAVFAGRIGEPPPELAPAAIALLERYPWPGNIRELRNAIEHAVVLAEEGVIGAEHLPASVAENVTENGAEAPSSAPPASMVERVAGVEKQSIEEALAAEGGNQTHAARRLGISRRALIYKLQKYGIGR